jgi:hypothetical protein
MKTGHKDQAQFGKIPDLLGTDHHKLAESRPHRKGVFGFAMHFAGIAGDAFLGVMG